MRVPDWCLLSRSDDGRRLWRLVDAVRLFGLALSGTVLAHTLTYDLLFPHPAG